jgi:fluoroacetyl-CoA thioesterase
MLGPTPLEATELEPGIEATLTVTVNEDMTAAHLGSGSVGVLATPQVVALVERAAVSSLRGRLPDGTTSVGTSVVIDHLAPTPPGAEVTATVRLQGVDGRNLRFSFTVSDTAGDVARGTHVRVVVERAAFEDRAHARVGDLAAGEPPSA